MTVEDCIKICEENDSLMLEPRVEFDPMVRGVMLKAGNWCAVYSLESIVDMFVERDKMSLDDAYDWVSYNIATPQASGWPVIVSEEDGL
jgi:hypothetical protein